MNLNTVKQVFWFVPYVSNPDPDLLFQFTQFYRVPKVVYRYFVLDFAYLLTTLFMLCILLYRIGNGGNKLFVFVFVLHTCFNSFMLCATPRQEMSLSVYVKQ